MSDSLLGIQTWALRDNESIEKRGRCQSDRKYSSGPTSTQRKGKSMSLPPHGGLNHGPVEEIIILTGTHHLNYMNGKEKSRK